MPGLWNAGSRHPFPTGTLWTPTKQGHRKDHASSVGQRQINAQAGIRLDQHAAGEGAVRRGRKGLPKNSDPLLLQVLLVWPFGCGHLDLDAAIEVACPPTLARHDWLARPVRQDGD